MAVSSRIADYYPHFRKRVLGWLITAQLLIISLTLGVTYGLLQIIHGPNLFIALVIAGALFFCFEIIVSILTFETITEPVRIIASAVNHVSKQLTDLPPPDINQRKFEKSGLKALVQTIYNLALNAPEIPNSIPTADNLEARQKLNTASSTSANTLLESIPCGIIGLNKAGEIAFSNKLAPVRISAAGSSELELSFEHDGELNTWRSEAESGKLRDQKTWSRIADKLPEETDRRIFDVIANYEKDSASGYDTVIITIDRTNDYATAEEDMDFIALAAHELRGPITVIRGYLDVLRDELSPLMQPDQTELIDRLNVSANRLSGYINNILNVSRYDRRHLQLHLHEDKLNEIVDSLKSDLDMRARTQNRLLSYTVPTDLPTVAADRNSLSEVISNLVDNAIKYSNDGGQIIVSAITKGDFVECTVQDFGIGIPGNVVQNLFSKFYRSHVSRQTVAGTGLGLYISKAIIESHGGQIWVSSTEGQGSIFGFTLPVYSTVADKLLANDNDNQGIIVTAHGWIKNHSMVRK